MECYSAPLRAVALSAQGTEMVTAIRDAADVKVWSTLEAGYAVKTKLHSKVTCIAGCEGNFATGGEEGTVR